MKNRGEEIKKKKKCYTQIKGEDLELIKVTPLNYFLYVYICNFFLHDLIQVMGSVCRVVSRMKLSFYKYFCD